MMPISYKTDSDSRKKQIDTLKIFNQNVTEIIPNEEYSVAFKAGEIDGHISVYLAVNFPNEKPRLVCNPTLNHHWIDSSSGEILNFPGLLNFTVHSDLGRVVLAIIREFERFPPSLISSNDNSSSNHDHQLSPISTIPELENLSIDELKLLDSDAEYLDDFIGECGFVKRLNNDFDALMIEVESIASENMSREQILNDMKEHLNEAAKNFSFLGEKYEATSIAYKNKSEEFTPQHIRELLQIAVSTSDTICESHVTSFLNEKVEVNAFISNYMEAKKLSAMRKAKDERLERQLNALERAIQ